MWELIAERTGAKTQAGQRVLKDRSVPLSPRQRAAFILVDGRRTLGEVLASTAAMGVTAGDLEHLIGVGLIEALQAPDAAASNLPTAGPAPVSGEQSPHPPGPASEAAGTRTPQQRYQDAYPLATRITADMGLRGFRLNLAVEAAGSFEQLAALAPRIEEAVGPLKFGPLRQALHG